MTSPRGLQQLNDAPSDMLIDMLYHSGHSPGPMSDKQKLREIKILLEQRHSGSSREAQQILSEAPSTVSSSSLLSIFRGLFSVSKYTNREMVHFMDVFMRFCGTGSYDLGEIPSTIVKLKFIPSEKETDLAILKYFEAMNFLVNDLPLEATKEVLSRYTYMLCNKTVSRALASGVYDSFRTFLRKKEHLLRLFLSGKAYLDFTYVDNFVVDFIGRFSAEEVVEACIECSDIRLFIINHSRSKYLFQHYFNSFPMWFTCGQHSNVVPYLFYTFGRTGLYRNIASLFYRMLDSRKIVEFVRRDLCIGGIDASDAEDEVSSSVGCDVCLNKSQPGDGGFPDLGSEIEEFNATGSIDGLYTRYGQELALELLRYAPETDLKQLGAFLCKLKNEPDLKKYTSTFDFHDVDVLGGLREYLKSFHLASEGQIIHRVIENYAMKYFEDNAGRCTLMEIADDEKTRTFIFNLSFSFIVLNTKFTNPYIKSKPAFGDYMKDFSREEIPESFTSERLESMYLSVKESPLEFPTKNSIGGSNYRVYRRICGRICHSEGMTEGFRMCILCRTKAHRELFRLHYKALSPGDPKSLHFLCTALDVAHPYEEMLLSLSSDTSGFLDCFKYYLSMRGRPELYFVFFDVLKRIQKSRTAGVMTFIKGQADFKDRVQSQYRELYKDLVSSGVLDINVVCNAYGEYKDRDELRFVGSVVTDILERNIDEARDLSMIGEDGLSRLMMRCVMGGSRERFCRIAQFMSSGGLLRTYREVLSTELEFVRDEVLDLFKGIPEWNEDGFMCVVLLQGGGTDMFDFVVEVQCDSVTCRAINAGEEGDERPVEKDILRCYSIREKYAEILSDPTNLFHFYGSSSSVLNQSRAKSIHRSGCPLAQQIFSPEEMDKRVIYMIKKADVTNNRDVGNYTLWIINLLSSSLPLLTRFLVRNFGLLLTLKTQLIPSGCIKIFHSRLTKVMNGASMCCDCGYCSLADVEEFMGLLLKYDLAHRKDFEFYRGRRKRMLEEGEIENVDGVLFLRKGGGDVEERVPERSMNDPDYQL
jgi:golgi-specific brefeldin A-resistance guanine nucleotide exchange factor 1